MIAADREYAPAAEQVEVAIAGLVEQVLAAPGAEAYVEAYGLEHADHLAVKVARMQRVALRFPGCEQRRGVQRHANLPARPGASAGRRQLDRGRDSGANIPSGRGKFTNSGAGPSACAEPPMRQ